MSFFDNIGEWLYANFSSEYEENAATHREVAAAQLANQQRLYDEGKVDLLRHWEMTNEVRAAGEMTARERERDSSGWNLASAVPWWWWVGAAIGVWVWLGRPGWRALRSKMKS